MFRKKITFDLEEFRSRPLPTEQEIIARWADDLDKPVVSVICNTFNQEKYIEDAIRGFLIQETDFPFEVIINDDASTDSNPTIISEYAEKYPKIIKPVFQKVNQYSQGLKPSLIGFSHTSGKYIALCEGDDFWISNDKLQRQVDGAKLSNCQLVFSSALLLRDGKLNGVTARHQNNSGIISLKRVVFGGGAFCPTASLLFDRVVLEKLQKKDWFINAPVGDLYIQAFASISFGAYFLNYDTCVYRQFSNGSWSSRKKEKSEEIVNLDKQIKSLKGLGEYFLDDSGMLEGQMIAHAYYFTALKLLMIKDYVGFKKLMIMSKMKITYETNGFKVFYRLKSFPRLAYFINKLMC